MITSRSGTHRPTGEQARLSDRTFGATMTGFFLVLSSVAWLVFDRVLTWALIAAAALAVAALIRPAVLWPLNLFWCRGVTPRIGALINVAALGLFYFAVVTPAALFMRLIGRDLMARSFDASRTSYFEPVERQARRENFREVF